MVSGKLYKGLNKLFMREKKSTTKKLYSNKVLGAASSNHGLSNNPSERQNRNYDEGRGKQFMTKNINYLDNNCHNRSPHFCYMRELEEDTVRRELFILEGQYGFEGFSL
jgi:hypothetical protein